MAGLSIRPLKPQDATASPSVPRPAAAPNISGAWIAVAGVDIDACRGAGVRVVEAVTPRRLLAKLDAARHRIEGRRHEGPVPLGDRAVEAEDLASSRTVPQDEAQDTVLEEQAETRLAPGVVAREDALPGSFGQCREHHGLEGEAGERSRRGRRRAP